MIINDIPDNGYIPLLPYSTISWSPSHNGQLPGLSSSPYITSAHCIENNISHSSFVVASWLSTIVACWFITMETFWLYATDCANCQSAPYTVNQLYNTQCCATWSWMGKLVLHKHFCATWLNVNGPLKLHGVRPAGSGGQRMDPAGLIQGILILIVIFLW
jgi:hypothetical protein